MGLIEPLAIAPALPSGILPLGSSLFLFVPLTAMLVLAGVGLWFALPRGPRPLRALRLVYSAT